MPDYMSTHDPGGASPGTTVCAAGRWEFPGGKIEPGESRERALRRELLEEFGIEAEIGRFLGGIVHHYPHITIQLRAYQVDAWRGELVPREHQAIVWALRADIAGFDLADADRRLVQVMYGLPAGELPCHQH